MKTVDDFNFKGKKVIIRVDFNVPLNHNRQVVDDTRIRESIPTIEKVLDDGASVILMSHLGRPKGGFEEDYSLSPIAPRLAELLNRNVIFTRDLFCFKKPTHFTHFNIFGKSNNIFNNIFNLLVVKH